MSGFDCLFLLLTPAAVALLRESYMSLCLVNFLFPASVRPSVLTLELYYLPRGWKRNHLSVNIHDSYLVLSQ